MTTNPLTRAAELRAMAASVRTDNSETLANALAEIEQLRAELARVSDELGLPPSIGPAPGALRQILGHAAEGITLRARCEKLEKALEAWLEDVDTPCVMDSGGRPYCVQHSAWLPCPHQEARRLTAEAREAAE